MSLEPVLPPLLLAVLVVVLVAARVSTFGRVRAQAGGWAAVWRWSALTAAGVLLVVAALGPTVGGRHDAVPRPAGDRSPISLCSWTVLRRCRRRTPMAAL